MTININAPKAVTILLVINDKIRIITNDEKDYDFWSQYLVADNKELQYHLDTKYPIESIINAYWPVISFGDPTSEEGKDEVTKALNSLLPTRYDEILFDYSKGSRSAGKAEGKKPPDECSKCSGLLNHEDRICSHCGAARPHVCQVCGISLTDDEANRPQQPNRDCELCWNMRLQIIRKVESRKMEIMYESVAPEDRPDWYIPKADRRSRRRRFPAEEDSP